MRFQSELSAAARAWIDERGAELSAHPTRDDWMLYAAGALVGGRRDDLAEHLVRCRDCRQVARDLAHRLAKVSGPPAAFGSRSPQAVSAAVAALVEPPEETDGRLVVELCEASLRAAADDARAAIALAESAFRIAARDLASEGFAARLRGFAAAHVANAWRVLGELAQADRWFARSEDEWDAGEGSDPEGRLDGGLRAEMRAALLRSEGRLGEMQEVLAEAIARSPTGERRARLLIQRAGLHLKKGDASAAWALLAEAQRSLAAAGDPRVRLSIRSYQTLTLLFLGRSEAAADRMPDVRSLASERGHSLDRLRVRWLDAEVSAGCGELDEAIAQLAGVVAEFADRGMQLDAALGRLEMGLWHFEAGRTREARELALEAESTLHAHGAALDGLSAVRLFVEAIRSEQATLALARSAREELMRR